MANSFLWIADCGQKIWKRRLKIDGLIMEKSDKEMCNESGVFSSEKKQVEKDGEEMNEKLLQIMRSWRSAKNWLRRFNNFERFAQIIVLILVSTLLTFCKMNGRISSIGAAVLNFK